VPEKLAWIGNWKHGAKGWKKCVHSTIENHYAGLPMQMKCSGSESVTVGSVHRHSDKEATETAMTSNWGCSIIFVWCGHKSITTLRARVCVVSRHTNVSDSSRQTRLRRTVKSRQRDLSLLLCRRRQRMTARINQIYLKHERSWIFLHYRTTQEPFRVHRRMLW